MNWLMQYSNFLLLLVIIASATHEKRQKHVGRVDLVANTVSIVVAAGSVWPTLHPYAQLWVAAGLPVCLVSFVSYMARSSLPTMFYRIGAILYNSAVAVIFVVLSGSPWCRAMFAALLDSMK